MKPDAAGNTDPAADDRPEMENDTGDSRDDRPDVDDDTVLVGSRTEPGSDRSPHLAEDPPDDEPTRIVAREPTAANPPRHLARGLPQEPLDEDHTRIVKGVSREPRHVVQSAGAQDPTVDEQSQDLAQEPLDEEHTRIVAREQDEHDATRIVAREQADDDTRIVRPVRAAGEAGPLVAESDPISDDETVIADSRSGAVLPGRANGSLPAGPPMGLISGGRLYQAPDVASGAKQVQPRRAATSAPVDRVDLPSTSVTLPASADQLRAAARKRERRRGGKMLVAVAVSTVLVASAAGLAIWLMLTFAT